MHLTAIIEKSLAFCTSWQTHPTRIYGRRRGRQPGGSHLTEVSRERSVRHLGSCKAPLFVLSWFINKKQHCCSVQPGQLGRQKMDSGDEARVAYSGERPAGGSPGNGSDTGLLGFYSLNLVQEKTHTQEKASLGTASGVCTAPHLPAVLSSALDVQTSALLPRVPPQPDRPLLGQVLHAK